MATIFFDSILMLRFREAKVLKEELFGAKRNKKNLGC